MNSQSERAPNRNVGGRPPGLTRRRRELIASYVAALGGADRVCPVRLADVERTADLVLLAKSMRGKALAGEVVNISDLTRLEGAADRAVRRLNLPTPGLAPVQSLADYLASRHAAKAEG